jgi:DNA-binding beta-propeller fold protein YncE
MMGKRSSGGGAVGGVGVGFGGVSGLRLAGLLALVVGVFLAIGIAPAFAKETHLLEESFGEAGSGPGQLALQASNLPSGIAGSGIAVNQETGDVYVADTGNGRVAQFDAGGTFIRNFGSLSEPTFVAVDNSGSTSEGDVYVGDSATGSVYKFEADGTPVTTWAGSGKLEGFSGLNGLAVGPGGDLFVLAENNFLHRYEADATAVGSPFEVPREAVPGGLAIDTESNLYKVTGNEQVNKFGPAGENLSEVLDAREDAVGLGIDPSDDSLYVLQTNRGAPFVDRFALGCGEGCIPVDSFGEGELSSPSGIAIDATTHNAYVANAAASHVDVFKAVVVPDVTATAVSENQGVSAVVHGEVNPDAIALTGCAFEYVTQAAFEQTGFANLGSGGSAVCADPDAAEVGEGSSPVPVQAELQGLIPNTAYRFRLTAANVQGADHSQSLPLTTLGPPAIDTTSASEVSATAAKLETELNPHGLATAYHFEYDTTPYAEGEGPHGTPAPAGSAGTGTAEVTRSAAIAGLAPSTTYHFRVVATNSLGTTDGPDRSFTTQPASAASLLPDSRGWELVSPPDKHGIPLESLALEGGVIQAAADGSGLAYIALGSLGPEAQGNRSALYSQQLASRAPSGGWSSNDIATPHQAPAGANPGKIGEYLFFSADLSRAALQPEGATPLSPQASERTPYLRQPDGSFTPLLNPANVPGGTQFGGQELQAEHFETSSPSFITGTPDLGHLLLESPKALTTEFAPAYEPTYESPENTYEWSSGALRLVSRIPAAGASLCVGPACVPASEEGRVSNVGNSGFQVRHAISDDGSRVVFHTASPAGLPSLFLRDLATGETLALDAAAPNAEGESGAAVYQDASADGSRVFFTDDHRLTVGSTATEFRPDLYMCQVEETPAGLACGLRDLTANAVEPAEPATVLGSIVGASTDGSVLYFAANGALTVGEGAVHGDCGVREIELTPQQRCNLYRYDVGPGLTRLVAVLSGADATDWERPTGANPDLGKMTSRLSPDGRFLAFMSSLPLTGYDNRDAVSRAPDEEVFLYDSATGRLACASCNPSGARPHGFLEPETAPGPLVDRRQLWTGRWLAANLPGWDLYQQSRALYQSRYLSDSGSLFFNSYDSLSPADTDGTADVYQFEPSGVGSCSPAAPGFAAGTQGCVGLISSGTSAEESAFLDASESGDDVFFITASRLTGRDEDGALDIYDARVGGGEPEPVKPVECSGDACQQPAVPAAHPTPGTLLVNGPGNVVECAKGKVKQKGKCVKKKQTKKKSKKHKKKGKHKKSKAKNGKNKKNKRAAGHKHGGQK